MNDVHVPGAGKELVVFTAAARPDLWNESLTAFGDAWPEYNSHGDVSGQYFGALVPRYEHLQLLVWDADAERLIARGRTIPFTWDGTLADLPEGIDELGLRALEETRPPTALSALAAEVATDHRGSGTSSVVIAAMADAARAAGLGSLVAPVRPSRKDRFPLTPIEEYHDLDTCGRTPPRSLDANPRAPGRHDPPPCSALAPDHRTGRGLGELDGHGVPHRRGARLPGGSRTPRSARRRRLLLGAERLDAPPPHGAMIDHEEGTTRRSSTVWSDSVLELLLDLPTGPRDECGDFDRLHVALLPPGSDHAVVPDAQTQIGRAAEVHGVAHDQRCPVRRAEQVGGVHVSAAASITASLMTPDHDCASFGTERAFQITRDHARTVARKWTQMTQHADVPDEIVTAVRSVCRGLPEIYEEQAWVGTRWRIRNRTFAHVLMIAAGWPPAVRVGRGDGGSDHRADLPVVGSGAGGAPERS